MLKLIALFICPLLACSDSHNSMQITVQIRNKAKMPVDSVKIGSFYGFVVVRNLKPDSAYTCIIDKIINHSQREGATNIVVVQKDSIVFGGDFGYYMDASGIKDNYKIIIRPDYSIVEE